METPTPLAYEDVHALTVTMLRTGVTLSDLLGTLLDDLPEDAFAGETSADVLIEMLTGTIMPVANGVGSAVVHDTVALLDAICDRVLSDLRQTVDLARRGVP
jgi:hypothetical protein